jgi:hypothetical protein
MAFGDYYNPNDKEVFDGDVASAADLNAINTAVDTAFQQVATDLDTVDSKADSAVAQSEAWATDEQGTNPDPLQPTKYSSFANAQEAKAWASGIGGVDTEADGSTVIPYSAQEKAAEASASAGAASTSEGNALASENAASLSETNALASENAASLSETNALASENKANEWAEKAEDVEVETGQYSALHWAAKAAASSNTIPSFDAPQAGDEGHLYAVKTVSPHEAQVSTIDIADVYTTADDVVETLTGTTDEIDVDNSDPANPVISISSNFNAGGLTNVTQTTSTTVSASNNYRCINTTDITLTLPASPSDGDRVGFEDTLGNFATDTVTIARNGKQIMEINEDLLLNLNWTALVLEYNSSSGSWYITQCTPVV